MGCGIYKKNGGFMKKIFLMCFLVLTIVLLSVSSVFATEYEFVENLNLNDLSTWESGV